MLRLGNNDLWIPQRNAALWRNSLTASASFYFLFLANVNPDHPQYPFCMLFGERYDRIRTRAMPSCLTLLQLTVLR